MAVRRYRAEARDPSARPRSGVFLLSGSRESEARSRRFQDGEGRFWIVSERPASETPVAMPRSLVFDSDYIVRRVRNFPEDWMSLAAPALERLSWSR